MSDFIGLVQKPLQQLSFLAEFHAMFSRFDLYVPICTKTERICCKQQKFIGGNIDMKRDFLYNNIDNEVL